MREEMELLDSVKMAKVGNYPKAAPAKQEMKKLCRKVFLESEGAYGQKKEANILPVEHSMAAWQMEGRQLMEEAEAAKSRARRIRVSGS